MAAPEAPAATTMVRQVQTPDYSLNAEGVTVPGYVSNGIPGAPQLPLTSVTFELPLGATWEVSYSSAGDRLLDQEVRVPAVPVPDLVVDSPDFGQDPESTPGAVPTVDRPDPLIYGRDAFYPESPMVVGQVQRQRGQQIVPVQVFPFQYNPVTHQLRYHPDLTIRIQIDPGSGQTAPSSPAQSVQPHPPVPPPFSDAQGALKVHTRDRGLYRLAYDDLDGAGVPVGIGGADPDSFAMFYLGQPIDVLVTGAEDGHFDPGDLVIFYAIPYESRFSPEAGLFVSDGRYQDYNIYWFAYGSATAGPRMAPRTVSAPPVIPSVATITQTLQIENNVDYRTAYERPKNADHFFDAEMTADSSTPTVVTDYPLALDDPITASGTVQITAVIHGGQTVVANPDQSVAIRLNSHAVGTYQWDGSVDHLIEAAAPSSWLDGAPNQVTLEAALDQLPGLGSYWISPDWVQVSYPALAEAEDDHIYVQGVLSPAGDIAVAGFTTQVSAFDVTDPQHPTLLEGIGIQPVAGSQHAYWTEPLPNRSYYLSSENALLAPGAVEFDTPSGWATADHNYDYITIVGAERSFTGTTDLGDQLAAAVQPLLDYRAAEGLRPVAVSVTDIYDEFSYGRVDPEAIRQFLTYAYWNWNQGQEPPQYVLLLGDGSQIFRGEWANPFINSVPPYLDNIDPYWLEIPADNRYVSVDGEDDYLPDMSIGRVSANSAADVTAVVDKIFAYESETTNPSGSWQQRTVYVADNYADPAGNFHDLSEAVRLSWLPSAYQSQPIYYRSSPDLDTGAEMRAAIKAAYNAGGLFLQWFGHANQGRWGSVSMFNINDVPVLAGNTQLPFSEANACLSGNFVVIPWLRDRQSLGETLVLTPGRGSVADLSPSGLHIGSALLTFDQGVHQALFLDRIPRAGDVADAARLYFFANSASYHDIIDTMIFFGDPATRLRLPEGDLSTSSLEVTEATANAGDLLHYTLTVRNSSIFTLSHPTVEVDYPENLATVNDAGGGTDNGDTLTWVLPDLASGEDNMLPSLAPNGEYVLTFVLMLNDPLPAGTTELVLPAQITSQMAPAIALQASTSINAPLGVVLADFQAQAMDGVVRVTWETASELNNQGFNLYRSPVPSTVGELLAYVPSQTPGSTQGASYEWVDSQVQAGQTYWYWLEDVDLAGQTTLHGPVSAMLGAPTAVGLSGLDAASGYQSRSSLWSLVFALAGALAAGWAASRRWRWR
jgi:hypothetical protein